MHQHLYEHYCQQRSTIDPLWHLNFDPFVEPCASAKMAEVPDHLLLNEKTIETEHGNDLLRLPLCPAEERTLLNLPQKRKTAALFEPPLGYVFRVWAAKGPLPQLQFFYYRRAALASG